MIENEIKYVIGAAAGLEAALARTGSPQRIEQGYLDGRARIRRIDGRDCWFTYKHLRPDHTSIEIETPIEARFFGLLWADCAHTLRKSRFKLRHGAIGWDVDFFKSAAGANYFTLAEAEMPEGMAAPPEIHPLLRDSIVFAVPREDKRFRSYLLADEAYAAGLMASLAC